MAGGEREETGPSPGWPSGRFISEKLSEGSRLLAIGIHAGKANDQPRPGLPFG